MWERGNASWIITRPSTRSGWLCITTWAAKGCRRSPRSREPSIESLLCPSFSPTTHLKLQGSPAATLSVTVSLAACGQRRSRHLLSASNPRTSSPGISHSPTIYKTPCTDCPLSNTFLQALLVRRPLTTHVSHPTPNFTHLAVWQTHPGTDG